MLGVILIISPQALFPPQLYIQAVVVRSISEICQTWVQLLSSPNVIHVTDAETEAQGGETAGIQGQSVLTPQNTP